MKCCSKRWVLTALALLLIAAPSAHAQTFYWDAAGGNWSYTYDWNFEYVPFAGSDVQISNPGGADVYYDYSYDTTNEGLNNVEGLNSLTIDNPLGSPSTYFEQNFTDSNMYAATETIGGASASGLSEYDQEFGTNTVTGTLTLGAAASSGSPAASATAEYTMGNEATLTAATENIGFANSAANNDVADVTEYGGASNGTSLTPIGLIDVGVQSGSVGTYQLGTIYDQGGNINANVEIVGDAGNATFTESTGSNTIAVPPSGPGAITDLNPINLTPIAYGTLIVGSQGGPSGTPQQASYILQGGYLTAVNEFVGYTNSSTNHDVADFNENNLEDNALNTVGVLDVGVNQGSVGTYELTGDTGMYNINANVEVVGDAGNATFTQNGGINTVSTIIDPSSFTITNLTISTGLSGTATETFATGSLIVGYQGGSSGSPQKAEYDLSGVSLQASAEYVGYGNNLANGDTAKFVQDDSTSISGYTQNLTGPLEVGFNPHSVGSYELDGDANSFLSSGGEVIGDQGTGKFTQNGGFNYGYTITVGNQAGSTGNYIMHGGSINMDGEIVGNNNGPGDIADFKQDDSVAASTNDAMFGLYMGYSPGSVGTFELSGDSNSTLISNDELIGYQGTATFTQSGTSSNTIDTYNNVLGQVDVGFFSGSNGTYNMSGGSQFYAGNAYVAVLPGSTGSINVDGSGTYFDANKLSVGGSASSPGGTASFTLTNGSTAHVATKVSVGANGFIDVADNGGGGLTIGSTSPSTLAANGQVRVNSGGVLGGNGLITGNVLNFAGIVGPGDPAKLTIDGNYTEAAAGVLVLDIAGPTSYDQLDVEGAFAAEPGSTLEIDFIDGFLPTSGETFDDLIAYQSIDGNFSNVVIEGLAPGFDYSIDPSADGGTDFKLDALNNGMPVAVPEPSTWAMLVVGTLGLFYFRRTRTRRTRA